jgi:hypothetical protein
VKVGIRNGDDVQIVSGLDAAEKVIVSGGYGLPDKTQIKLQEATPSKDGSDNKADSTGGLAKPETPGKE